MLTKQLALVSLSKRLTVKELSQTAAALQKQITRDLGPIWNIQATIDYFPDLKSVPLGYWPIIISEDINEPGAAGFHTDKHHQPYSLVELDDTWQLTCSHEMCEMLVDPYGNKIAFAKSIKEGQGKVKYLVEVCDPCEDASCAYSINGILVSDFYTPNYFDPQAVSGVRYSYTGSLTKPLDMVKNGYLSWQDPVSKAWYQADYFGSSIKTKVLTGIKDFGESLRSQMDRLTKNPNGKKVFKAAARKHLALQTMVYKSGESMSEEISEEIQKFITIKSKNLLAAAAGLTANITVNFFKGGVADNLIITVNKKGIKESKTVDFNGGIKSFEDVSSNDSIKIDGLCVGTAVVIIDIPLNNDPPPSYPAGTILDFFTVK